MKTAAWLGILAAVTACTSDSLDPDGGATASVVITPSAATVAVGASVPLKAEVLDGAGAAITGRKVVWASGDVTVATVSSDGVVTGVKVGSVQIAASAEGKSAIAHITVNPTPVASVRVSPTSRDLLVGQNVQLVAEPLDANGTVLLGRPVNFTTSNVTVATVSAAGLVTALAPGSSIITAASEGKTAVATVTVAIVPVASVVVTPSASPLVVGQTAQLTAEPRDVSGQVLAGRLVSWSTSAPSVASVSSTGLVTAIAPGGAIISATSEGKAGTVSVVVNPKPVSAVIVSPGQASVTVGQTTQLTGLVTDEQGNVLAGRPITFSSSANDVATVSGSGVVTGIAPGTATITATSEGKTGTATVTVTPIPVATVVISPTAPNVVVGGTVQLSATPRSASGQVLSGRTVGWSSGAPSIAAVSATGVVTGVSPGSAVMFANVEGVIGTVTVTVRQVPVETVVVTPATSTVVVGGAVQLSASVRDASGAELTGRLVGWSSSDEAVAVVSSTGRVTALKVGTVTITASSEGKSGTATVTVTPAPVASVTVTPPSANINVGQTATLTAQTLDGTGGVLTGRAVTWSSNNTGIATVSQSGVVTGVAPGNATITATSEGKSGTAAITVSPIPVATVTVAPTTLPLIVGQTGTLTATTRDAANNILTGRAVTWSSSNTGIATVAPNGTVTAVAPGSATITASSEGKSGTATVTVTAVPVGSVSVTPGSATVNVAFTTTLSASVRDVNGVAIQGAAVSWSTDKPTTAVVSPSGVVTGVAPGMATISATTGGRSGTAAITVQLAPVATVTLTPSTLNLRDRNEDRNGQLTATLRDALGNILTGRMVAWSSSDPSIATVNQTGGVTAQDRGTATITAASEGKNGTATVEVRN